MGRGRQKAKHTKVARELKYFSPNTDYNALERELGTVAPDGSVEPDYEDKWADLYGEDAEDGDDDADGDEDSVESGDDGHAGESADASVDADGGGGSAD